jgi:GNAT superfamily N-acetyltransferase
MHSDYGIVEGDGTGISNMLDKMAEVYAEVYAEPPYNSGPLWQSDAFLDRTRRQAARPGFAIVLARSHAAEIVGYAFGLPFESGRWWSGNASEPPREILAASKFAVIELIVRKPWRGRGIARHLHDRLLGGRPEPYAVLTALPAAPARQVYRRWGWEQVGTAQHTPDSPVLDALALSLSGRMAESYERTSSSPRP